MKLKGVRVLDLFREWDDDNSAVNVAIAAGMTITITRWFRKDHDH